ncbi:MAG: hypothetical protein FJ290_15830 [Planctomycetes bacterium]|nr:hypothetical protein [Planctomycetota bacterium]
MGGPRCAVIRLGLALAALYAGGRARALIVGRDAEGEAAKLEREGKFREAAVWRLAAARAFDELIIPFEVEQTRAYSQFGKRDLAAICTQRAEKLYPPKVKANRALYEQDLQKAGGEEVRAAVERDVTELLAKFAYVPTAIPCRLSDTAQKEREGKWAEAADCREVAARVYLLITAPFFEREGGRAKDEASRRRWQAEALNALKLARESFLKAADNYQRAAAAPKAGAVSPEFCKRKAGEMQEQAEAAAALIKAKEQP